jgi:glutamyl-tRNA reductase
MYIHCLGLNHQTAQVSLRERMALSEEKTKTALICKGGETGSRPDDLSEMVILSTCNRVELYAVSPEPGYARLLAFLADIHQISAAEFEPYLYHYVDQAAVEHLYQVAAGLDSMVLGEPQILGQVTRAFELAQSQKWCGPVLSRLFQSAIHAGKRARAETQISHNPTSISSLAASLAEQAVKVLDQAQIVIVGAGEMAELAVEALRKRGANRILVVSRNPVRAAEFMRRWDAQVITFDHLQQALSQADILITSTGAPHTIIQRSQVVPIMQDRQDRPLVAIDIAVPRDIDPQVGDLPGIRLYDIDSLNQQLEQSLAERVDEVPRVEQILVQEEAQFIEYLKTLDILPLISYLRGQAEEIRRSELEKTLRRLPELNDLEVKRIEALTEALVKKLVDVPITRLRAKAQYPCVSYYAQVAGALYGFDETQEHNCDLYSGTCPLALYSETDQC